MPDIELCAADVAGGEPERLFRFGEVLLGATGMATDVSPDGRQLALIAQRRGLWPTADVYLTGLEGREVEALWRDEPGDRKDARALWSSDGRRIAWHHNFTRGGLAESYHYGTGLAERGPDGRWRRRLQPEPEARVTPVAWSPDGRQLLCARMAPDQRQASLFLMGDQFQAVRELFELEVHSWQPGERDLGRLGDWSIVPDNVPLGEGR
jgi:Tol biopolymer transport system component